MPTYKTPNVYVEEISKFPPSVAPVATAIPAFIGYTERAERNGQDLNMTPTRIQSLLEYEELFGGAPSGTTTVSLTPQNTVNSITPSIEFFLYDSLQLFYDNGGGPCYIVSIGTYRDGLGNPTTPALASFRDGLDTLERVDEPTIILAPDATLLGDHESTDLYSFQQRALAQCAKLQDRVLICDLKEPVLSENFLFNHTVSQFRNNIGINSLRYGMAYTPWLQVNLPRTVRYRDIVLRNSADEIVNLNQITQDPGLLQLIFEMNAARSTAETVESSYADLIVPNPAPEIPATNPIERLNQLYGAFLTARADFNPDAPDSHEYDYFEETLQDMYGFVRDILAAVKEVYDALPQLPAADTQPSPADNTSNQLALRADIDLLINSLELSDTFRDLLQHHAGSATFATAVELFDTSDPGLTANLQSALNLLFGDGTITVATLAADFGTAGIDFTTEDYTDANDAISNDLERANYAANALNTASGGFMSLLEQVLNSARVYESTFDTSLAESYGFYRTIKNQISNSLSVLPPSGAIAGIYAKVDADRGVFKAPANVSLSSVVGPTELINNDEQEDLNVDVNAGKSINAIRTFTGKGTLVWGARTLAGNDNEWRYVNVRRYFNFAEESIKKATEPFVFEPNDANTWAKVKGMISNFLTNQWRDGALQGAKPAQAFFVKVGLGETMTAQDILEGRMIVEIGMAVVRPAEFIILRFSHKLPEA